MSNVSAKIVPCQCLRTKNPYGTSVAEHEKWHPTVITTSAFWCLNTMSSAGPDDHYVHLARCVEGRSCYQAPEEA
ncbi:MAG: hypothetical protein ACYCSN_16100 [Acidobacteriaceae bacterium]